MWVKVTLRYLQPGSIQILYGVHTKQSMLLATPSFGHLLEAIQLAYALPIDHYTLDHF